MDDLETLMEEAKQIIEVMDTSYSEFVPVQLTEKQRSFVETNDDETLYGGAAGGGKTVALLAAAARDVHLPGYSGVVFRRTFPQLNQAGGILTLAHEWWANNPKVTWIASKNEYSFPNGGTIRFSHLKDERDKYSHQGSEYHGEFFDELTQFTKTQYTYLKTRRRKNYGDPIELVTKASTNPGGYGHKWVKKRFIVKPYAGHVFIPSTMRDNPHLNLEEYEKSFDTLDSTTRDQLKYGKWIDNAGGIVYPVKPECIIDGFVPRMTTQGILAVDLGASEAKPSTSFIVMVWDTTVPNKVWVIHSDKKPGMTPSSIASHIKALMVNFPMVARVIVDAGALGVGYVKDFRKRYRLPVFAAEKRDKLGNRRLLIGAMEDGDVFFVTPGANILLEELEELMWNDEGTDVQKGSIDHAADGFLYAYRDAMAWMGRAEVPPPAVGSAKWRQQQEDEMIEHEIAESRRAQTEDGYGY